MPHVRPSSVAIAKVAGGTLGLLGTEYSNASFCILDSGLLGIPP